MKIHKTVKDMTINVEDWSSVVTITDKNTKEIIMARTFSDHIVAVAMAKKLLSIK